LLKSNQVNKTDAFLHLGRFFRQFETLSFNADSDLKAVNNRFAAPFENCIRNAEIHNPWFTGEFVRYSLHSLSMALQEDKITKWLSLYPEMDLLNPQPKNIGLVMAGNIPLVGFHYLICIILSGHRLCGKLSSKDDQLFPVIREILCFLSSEMENSVFFSDEPLKNMDAFIATGSNNSSRYFEYYFGKYPHIIRKNRNSGAIITGNESGDELRKLADDVFLYFGMGCRNVSRLFIPNGYDPAGILDSFNDYAYLYNHNKYANNYDYQKAVFLVNKIKHLDSGFLLLKEDTGYSSPIGVLYYERYDSPENLRKRLHDDSELIQCVVASDKIADSAVPFGRSQHPELWDYADNVDTIKFLLNLYKN